MMRRMARVTKRSLNKMRMATMRKKRIAMKKTSKKTSKMRKYRKRVSLSNNMKRFPKKLKKATPRPRKKHPQKMMGANLTEAVETIEATLGVTVEAIMVTVEAAETTEEAAVGFTKAGTRMAAKEVFSSREARAVEDTAEEAVVVASIKRMALKIKLERMLNLPTLKEAFKTNLFHPTQIEETIAETTEETTVAASAETSAVDTEAEVATTKARTPKAGTTPSTVTTPRRLRRAPVHNLAAPQGSKESSSAISNNLPKVRLQRAVLNQILKAVKSPTTSALTTLKAARGSLTIRSPTTPTTRSTITKRAA
jgi:hypothetical protein